MAKETVQIRALQRPDRSIYWELSVRSQVRPNLLRIGNIELERRDQTAKVMVLAAAIAEELCEKYGDTLDPSTVAVTARDCYREILSENIQLQPGHEPRDASSGVAGMA